MTESQTRYGQGLIVLLGLFTFACVLAFHNITEGDLWGKLAIGRRAVGTGPPDVARPFCVHASFAHIYRS